MSAFRTEADGIGRIEPELVLGIVSRTAHAIELALEKRQAPRDHRLDLVHDIPLRPRCDAPNVTTTALQARCFIHFGPDCR